MDKKELFEKAYKGSYYTILGVDNEKEYKEGYQKLLNELNIGKVKEWYSFTGKEFNEYYNVTGLSAFRPGLHILCFPVEGLNINKLAIFKLKMQDKWFDDIVDNLNK